MQIDWNTAQYVKSQSARSDTQLYNTLERLLEHLDRTNHSLEEQAKTQLTAAAIKFVEASGKTVSAVGPDTFDDNRIIVYFEGGGAASVSLATLQLVNSTGSLQDRIRELIEICQILLHVQEATE